MINYFTHLTDYKDTDGNRWYIYIAMTTDEPPEYKEYWVQKDHYGIMSMCYGAIQKIDEAAIDYIKDYIENIKNDKEWS